MKPLIHHGPRHAAPGFTLVELLISVSLMAGILMASYVCLRASLTGRSMVENRSDLVQTARVVMDRITADLRSADRLSEQHGLLGMDRTLEGMEADNIDFLTRHYHPKLPQEAQYCEISYFVTRHPETERFVLVRRRDALPDDKPLEGGNYEILAPHVFGLKLEYYDGWDWYDDWGDAYTPEETSDAETSSLLSAAGRTGLPDAVRITLLLGEDDIQSPKTPVAMETPEEGAPKEIPGTMLFQTMVSLNLSKAVAASGGGPSNDNANDSGNANANNENRSR